MAVLEVLKSWVNRLILFRKEKELTPAQKWVMGLLNLSCVVLFWVLSSFLVSDLFESGLYRKPFLITYINTACFTLYFFAYLHFEGLSVRDFVRLAKNEYQSLQEGLNDIETATYGSESDDNAVATQPDAKVGIIETITLSLQFCALWFSANLVTNFSLSYTSVASQTILSSTCSFFTLLVGFITGVERVNKNKIYGIVLCFAGVVIVTKDDSNSLDSDSTAVMVFVGNMLALFGALIYGIYTILLKMKTIVKNSTLERELNTHLFFAFVGIFCLVLMFPVIVILHFTGVERFEVPRHAEVWLPLITNMIITLISDFCWCKAVILTSPLTVTVGLSLTIPLAMVGDWLIKGFVLNWMYVSGAAIVTVGFLIINHDEREDFTHNHIE